MTKMQPELPFDLSDDSQRLELNSLVEQWIEDADGVHRTYIAEWDEVDARLNSTSIPSGFNKSATSILALKNSPTIGQQTKGKNLYFATVNRTRPNHESILGDFAAKNKKLAITATNPTDRNRAKVLQKYVDHIVTTANVPETVFFPAMDQAWSKGLGWINLEFNGKANMLKGRFEPKYVSCRDVLVDPSFQGPFFTGCNYLVHRFKMTVEDAKRAYRNYSLLDPDTLGTDMEYDIAWGSNPDIKRDAFTTTFYRVHFRRRVCHYYAVNPQTGAVQEISEQAFNRLSETPQTADFVFEGDEDWAYYSALYTRGSGVFDLRANPYGMWTLIPIVDYETDARAYPLGDVMVYANLADLLDTIVTVFVENARRANKLIGSVDQEDYEEFKDAVEAALKNGGVAPGLKEVHTAQPINSHLVNLIPWVMGWIQDSISKHPASMGEMPTKQVAKETVALLVSKDRQAHGRKDVTLGYALTQFARLLTRMISAHIEEPDYIPLSDQYPGSPGYIPINQIWTEAEYMSQLAKIYNLQLPMDPEGSPNMVAPQMREQARLMAIQQTLAFEQALMEAKQNFETENDVDLTTENGYIIDNTEVTEDQLLTMIEASGMEQQQFLLTYQPQPAQIKVYKINDMKEEPDVNVTYSVDQDYQNDPDFKMQRAQLLRNSGLLSGLDFLRDMGVQNPDQTYQNALKENQALSLAKEIAADPDLMNYVSQVIRNAKTQGAKPGSTEEPEDEED